jgi:DNA-binding transcriptional ArsR family regulator
MIRLQMSSADLERMRFAYSPLTETAESLYMLHSGRIHPLHRGWFEMTRERLRGADTALLHAVIPPRGCIAGFLLGGTADTSTSIEQQLQAIADLPQQRLRAELCGVWGGAAMPRPAQELIAPGAHGGRRLADALWRYWQTGIEPYWRQIRALLDADLAYRGGRLARGGIEALLSDLHPELELVDHAIQIVHKPASERNLAGAGLLLVPCVFAWPHIIADFGTTGPPSITYGPRGIGTLWQASEQQPDDDDALGELLGRTRAAILCLVALPRSTTDLARELGTSAPTVSAHLSILRRCGLVSSWRSGRRVLYQRTPLATSIVTTGTATTRLASGGTAESAAHPAVRLPWAARQTRK